MKKQIKVISEYQDLKTDSKLLQFLLKNIHKVENVEWNLNGDIFFDGKLIGNSPIDESSWS